MVTVKKSYPVAMFKALPDEAEGTFEAIVSTIGNVDLQGDRVVSGAYDKSIDYWQKSGNPLPVLWSHDWSDPFAHIGYVDPMEMREVKAQGNIPAGLYVKGHLDIDKPFAKQVYDLLAERRVTEWSFSYDIPPGGEKRAKDGANELLEVGLIEVGPTLKGASSITTTLGTKSDDLDENRTRARLAHALAEQWDVELKAINNEIAKAAWNGDAAMASCKNAADYRQIAFERANDSDPDTAAHWALPHHSSPGAEANPAGVAAALGALNGARGGAPDLKQSVDTVRGHLEAHQAAESKSKFSDDQPRDNNGRFASDGSSASTSDFKTGDPVLTPDGPGHLDEPGNADKTWWFVTNDETGIQDEYQTEQLKPRKSKAAGDPSALIGWFNDGADGAIDWGSPGDWQQCVDEASKHMSEEDAKGFCELRHQDATGMSTSEHAHAEGKSEKSLEDSLAKAGRVLSSDTISALKSKIAEAIDEICSEMNGDYMDDASKGDQKDYAKGYADGSARREKSSDLVEYVRGYEEGLKDRGALETTELAELNAMFDSLRIS